MGWHRSNDERRIAPFAGFMAAGAVGQA